MTTNNTFVIKHFLGSEYGENVTSKASLKTLHQVNKLTNFEGSTLYTNYFDFIDEDL